jgi:hypothetical protein
LARDRGDGEEDYPQSGADSARKGWCLSRSFWENLLLLAIGFMLTGVTGATLSYWYQREMAKHQALLIAEQIDLSQSIDAFRTISDLVGKRQFRMNRLVQALSGVAPAATRTERARDYRGAFVEWNDQVGLDMALYDFYFTEDAAAKRPCRSFQSIKLGFEAIHRDQLEPILEGNAGDIAKLRSATLNLAACIVNFDRSMLESIETKRKTYLAIASE